ncbi:MAG: hypothetical protein JO005_06820 [Gammaproteobacteria bacterium]|nr:hypothetical protein [Gammaproteobacteria bacterium]
MAFQELPREQQMQSCIDPCARCRAVRVRTASHYLERGGKAPATAALTCANSGRAAAA